MKTKNASKQHAADGLSVMKLVALKWLKKDVRKNSEAYTAADKPLNNFASQKTAENKTTCIIIAAM